MEAIGASQATIPIDNVSVLSSKASIKRRLDIENTSPRRIALLIFLTCWAVFALHFATNTVREIYPALSLGDHLSFDVSEYVGLHPDIFEIPGRGSFINNNPGAAMIGAIPYAVFRPVTDRLIERVQQSRAQNPQGDTATYDSIYPMAREFYRNAREKGYDIKFGLAAGTMQAFAMAPISALGAVVMFWILLGLTENRRASLWLSLLYAFATPIFYRTAQLNQNVLVANFALFAFALLWLPWKAKSTRRPFYFLAGLCAGWTVVLDYSGLVAVTILSIYALACWRSTDQDIRRSSDLVRFAAGVGVCAAILMTYQWVCFGNPILPAQSYMPAANFTDLGYRGFAFPQADLLLATAFDLRYGLFTSAPILLLFILVPIWARKATRILDRRETIFVVSFITLFFLFCAANQYGRMQFNSGVRHIVPVVPFMFLPVANVLLKIPRTLAVLIGLAATYWSWCLVMYRDVEQGYGVFEAIRHISTEGLRLPWLTTVSNMGLLPNVVIFPAFAAAAVFLGLIWWFGLDGRGANA